MYILSTIEFYIHCICTGSAVGVERRLKVVFKQIKMIQIGLEYAEIWNGLSITAKAVLCVLNRPRSTRNACLKR